MGFKSARRAVDALSLAIATGAPRAVRDHVARRPELVRHWRPIHEAAFHGRVELARLLLDAGADPNAAAPSIGPHFTARPLHRAVGEVVDHGRGPEHAAVARLLLDRGADWSARGGEHALRPLPLALLSGAPRLAEPLIEGGAEIDVYAAAALGDLPRVAASIREPSSGGPDVPDTNGMTALHYCVASRAGIDDRSTRRRLRDVAALLLDAGASHGDPPDPPDVADVADVAQVADASSAGDALPVASGRTALEWAVENGGNAEVIRLLLERGADPNHGELLLAALMTHRDTEIATLLLVHGADVDRPGRGGVPPLVALARWGRGGVVEWLLERGADPNVRASDGETALHAAVRRGLPDHCLRALIRSGADAHARDRHGRTVIDLNRGRGPWPWME